MCTIYNIESSLWSRHRYLNRPRQHSFHQGYGLVPNYVHGQQPHRHSSILFPVLNLANAMSTRVGILPTDHPHDSMGGSVYRCTFCNLVLQDILQPRQGRPEAWPIDTLLNPRGLPELVPALQPYSMAALSALAAHFQGISISPLWNSENGQLHDPAEVSLS